MATCFGDIHDAQHIGIGTYDVKLVEVGAEGQGAGCHPERLLRRHGHIDGFETPQVLIVGDADAIHVVGVGRGNEQPRVVSGIGVLRFFATAAVASDYVGGVRPERHRVEFVAIVGLVMKQRAIRPARHEQ